MRLLGTSLMLVALIGCSDSRQEERGAPLTKDKEQLIDVLTLFVESVQGDRFDRALGYLAPDEKAKMTEGSAEVPPMRQKQLKALRLSTLANKAGVHLENGKLAGIYPWLPNIQTLPSQARPGDAGPVITQ